MLVGHTFSTANQSKTGILYNKKSDYGTVLQYLFLHNITRGFTVQGFALRLLRWAELAQNLILSPKFMLMQNNWLEIKVAHFLDVLKAA